MRRPQQQQDRQRAAFALDKTALARTAGARMEPIFTMLRRVRWALTLKFSRSPATMLPQRFDNPQTLYGCLFCSCVKELVLDFSGYAFQSSSTRSNAFAAGNRGSLKGRSGAPEVAHLSPRMQRSCPEARYLD